MTGPLAEYQRRIAAGALNQDSAQQRAVDEFERLYRDLERARKNYRSFSSGLARLFGRARTEPVRGIYLYGSVGRGKTLLMDMFFHCLPFSKKKRQHFHRFMASIHERLRRLRDAENPLDIVADQLAAECRIICFDEFWVSDIADAMILGNLFSALFERGVTLAATSNIAPADLYRDGLQRQRFLAAIEAIETHTVVIELKGDEDYRLRILEGASVYLTPADDRAASALDEAFAAIAPDPGDRAGELEILGRAIRFVRHSDGIAWFDFAEVCDGPRSQDDYIELAREFQTVIVSEIPQFDAELENQARRFIALVDEFYDRKVKLILSAAAQLDSLYVGNRLIQEFERTRSRLTEMQSHEYLAEPHRP